MESALPHSKSTTELMLPGWIGPISSRSEEKGQTEKVEMEAGLPVCASWEKVVVCNSHQQNDLPILWRKVTTEMAYG